MFEQAMFWMLLGMIWTFGCAIVVIVIWHLRSRRRMERLRMIHEERLRAIEKGVSLPDLPALAEPESAFEALRANPRWPLGMGAISIALGAGVMAAFLSSSSGGLAEIWSLGLIGVFLGVGLILYHFLTRQPRRSSDAE